MTREEKPSEKEMLIEGLHDQAYALDHLKLENQRLRERVELEQQWRTNTVAQVMRLNQCVECGEMDEQDGVRKDGKFRCVSCVNIPELRT